MTDPPNPFNDVDAFIDFDGRCWRLAVAFRADQEPKSRGSKTPVPYRDKRGRLRVAVKDSCEGSAVWMQYVRAKAREAWRDGPRQGGPPIAGPCVLAIAFRFLRPRSHLSTRQGATRADVKPSAPADHVYTPDLTKLIRGVEDALSGVAWKDDCQVIGYASMTKHWSSQWHGADVAVYELAD